MSQPDVYGGNVGLQFLLVAQYDVQGDVTLLAFGQEVCAEAFVLIGDGARCLRASQAGEDGAELLFFSLQVAPVLPAWPPRMVQFTTLQP